MTPDRDPSAREVAAGTRTPRPSRTVACDAAGLRDDLAALDALARHALAARREGCSLEVVGATPELIALVELAGLAGVVRCRCPGQASKRSGSPNSGK